MTSLRATPLTALPPQFGPHAAGACPTRLGGTYSTALPSGQSSRMVRDAYGPAMDRDTGGDCVGRHLFVIGYP